MRDYNITILPPDGSQASRRDSMYTPISHLCRNEYSYFVIKCSILPYWFAIIRSCRLSKLVDLPVLLLILRSTVPDYRLAAPSVASSPPKARDEQLYNSPDWAVPRGITTSVDPLDTQWLDETFIYRQDPGKKFS